MFSNDHIGALLRFDDLVRPNPHHNRISPVLHHPEIGILPGCPGEFTLGLRLALQARARLRNHLDLRLTPAGYYICIYSL